MKTFYKLIFTACLFFVLNTACTRHGKGQCDVQLMLYFEYFADGDENVFQQHIQSLEFLIYNQEGVLLSKQAVTPAAIQRQQVQLALPPGEYRLVAWANRSEQSQYVALDEFATGRIQPSNYGTSALIKASDRLYYAQQELDVQLGETNSYPLTFESAHFNFNISVNGLEQEPSIQVQNIPAQYDMNKQLIPEAHATYHPEIDYHPEKESYFYAFSVFRFRDDSPITFILQNSELSKPLVFRLDELLASQDPPLSIEDKQEVVIPIEIDYDELQVNINIPDWDKEPSTPGIE